MASYRTIARLGLALALTAPLSAAVVACSGSQKGAQADIKAGEMPGGGDWTGVYYSPLYGHLHLIREGDSVIGKWRTAAGDKWGEMHGTANGDLYKYEWKETKIGMVGPNATSNGRGYFKYVIPDDNSEHQIKGQWGLGKDETGQVWEAIKQRNQSPDPASVMPDETEQRKEGWEESEEKAPKSEGGGEEGSGGGDDWE